MDGERTEGRADASDFESLASVSWVVGVVELFSVDPAGAGYILAEESPGFLATVVIASVSTQKSVV